MRPTFQLIHLLFVLIACCTLSCSKEKAEAPGIADLQLLSLRVGPTALAADQETEGVLTDRPIVATFSHPLDTSRMAKKFILENEAGEMVPMRFFYFDNLKGVSGRSPEDLKESTRYVVRLADSLSGADGQQFSGESYSFRTFTPPLQLESLSIDGQDLLVDRRVQNVGLSFELTARFSHAIDPEELESNLRISRAGAAIPLDVQRLDGDPRAFLITNRDLATHLAAYELAIQDGLTATEGNAFAGFEKQFFTKLDSTPKFPLIPDEALLTLVQRQTFRYFWDFAHPVSGLARERNTSLNTVTSGGSGFGLMALVVGMERGFITRTEGINRLNKITSFLATADRFHGVWSHWLNGETGEVIPFSADDDGADLVETSYLAMGLLTVRQYLDPQVPLEQTLIERINELWEAIEWNWHTQGGQDVLYWHWSPNFGWEKNLRIRGWNEALITYLMAAASPTYGIEPEVYHNGWARNGDMVGGETYFGIPLPLGRNYGGPLFFAHYTFLGIDPRNLSDTYADYWVQNVNHTRINRAYCLSNPQKYVGYGPGIWGLTASDGNAGYSAHSPTNDRGVITPTAALSSFPYTPDYSMAALKHFYYYLGDRLWGEYGFYDAFNPTEEWVANSFLAIDQGPIIVMIENHRSGLLWDLFMSCPEVQAGLDKLGFSY